VFRDKTEIFKDGSHLNAHGAEIFSTMLAEALQTKPHTNRPRMSSAPATNTRASGSRIAVAW